MPENQTPEYEKFRYGGLAAWLLGREQDSKYATGALKVLAGPGELDVGEDRWGFVEGTLASSEGIQRASGNFAKRFYSAMDSSKISDLAGNSWYSPTLEGLTDEDQASIRGTLGNFGNTTFGGMEKSLKRDSWILQAPEGEKTPEEKEQAQARITRYKPAVETLKRIDGYAFENIRQKAVDETRVTELSQYAGSLRQAA